MCRWLAYAGLPVFLDELLVKPENSLVRQSLAARHSHLKTQGDGFGLGWYGDRPLPGLYRDVMPAWNDANLRELAEQTRSHLFLAHVRASTGAPPARINCHPFRVDTWLFMHNGQIGCYDRIRRELDMRIKPDLYNHRRGGTDSEAMFLLALGHGLRDDPLEALRRTVAEIEAMMVEHGIAEPLRMTAAVSDGRALCAMRYASDAEAPSLFFCTGERFYDPAHGFRPVPGDGSVLVLSEALDEAEDWWREVPQDFALFADGGDVALEPFRAARAAA
ncbi:MAG: class II glutamine amidotransferase [Alphaproteobacteria bacterium]|nr:class II glutamine amidotransferase [Alphaproteobacteria bacterium]